MIGDNVSSADNQQERLKTIGWLVGFTDGLFEIANMTMRMNRKVKPRFLESSHTIRQTPTLRRREDIVATAWRHAGTDHKGNIRS